MTNRRINSTAAGLGIEVKLYKPKQIWKVVEFFFKNESRGKFI